MGMMEVWYCQDRIDVIWYGIGISCICWYWFRIDVVLVWYWCGIGVVLMWF